MAKFFVVGGKLAILIVMDLVGRDGDLPKYQRLIIPQDSESYPVLMAFECG